ncbi:hypothetical protein E4K10_42245 [Streptomyces sp. T1317-0309]|nr:hypothetical protein E4K10_42245 [Streptomyces sp. T1317-0309]
MRSGDLITLDDEDRPLPGRALRVPERVIAHLLGDDMLDGDLPGSVYVQSADEPDGSTGRADPGTGPFAGRLGRCWRPSRRGPPA